MEVFDVDLDRVEEDNIRGGDEYGDEAEEIRLGESLTKHQDYPIIVRPHITLAGSFLLVDGHRRTRAARRAGLKKLKAILVDKAQTQDQIRLLQLRTDLHKKHLSAHDRSMAAIGLEKANPGLNLRQLAALIEIDEALLWKYLQAKKLGAEALAAYKAGQIGMTAMVDVAKLTPDEQPALLQIKQDGGSRDDVYRESKKRRSAKDGSATVRASQIKCPLVSGQVVTVKGEDISLDEAIEALKDATKAMVKARDTGLDAKTAQAVWRDMATAG